LAAFGGIVACNRDVDEIAATSMTQGNKFLEVIAAPAFTDEAIAILSARWKNVRLLDVGPVKPLAADGGDFPGDAVTYHQILGGLLVQERDGVGVVESEWKIVSQRAPTDAERAAMRIAWLACKHVKSNAIVLARDSATVGIGGGQVDRVGAAGIAIAKAGDRAGGAVAASDAFFPFPDGPKRLLDAGATAIIQPGGSVRDQETIDLVNARNAAMIFTGRRHFRH
jgi:phosphoribosylaminoimidazolecarboxamide formyltransferase/IMP cyclohydrolase